MKTMKTYWNDCGRGPDSDNPVEVTLAEAHLIWSDELHGIRGNFFALIDDQDRTIQFYFDEGIPDHIDDAGDLQIVWMDFPIPSKNGSYGRSVKIVEVHGFIDKAFEIGADYREFGKLKFESW